MTILTAAYLRRKKVEARLLAVEIVKALSEAMRSGSSNSDATAVSPQALLREIGVPVE